MKGLHINISPGQNEPTPYGPFLIKELSTPSGKTIKGDRRRRAKGKFFGSGNLSRIKTCQCAWQAGFAYIGPTPCS